MIAVITGDIIKSRRITTKAWLTSLKKELNKLGKTPQQWEIYRGDSFQVEVKNPADALLVAIKIKAAIKCLKDGDVRMGIGIGNKNYNARQITASNGGAFTNSGELLEALKSLKMNLAVRSDNEKFNSEINLYLKLISIIMDSWTINAAEAIYTVLDRPGKSQEALGKLLKIKQNAVSTRLKRACYYEIKEVIEMYRTKITEL
ncbi:MAG: transcriptional regulator [Cyclobacteriaceae bacterium]|nr:transcriptional regulator [Cyclobacteriaceae bacterium]